MKHLPRSQMNQGPFTRERERDRACKGLIGESVGKAVPEAPEDAGREVREGNTEETFHKEHNFDLEDEKTEKPGEEDRYRLQ